MNTKKYIYFIQFILLITLNYLSYGDSGRKSTLIDVSSHELKSYISSQGKIINGTLFSPYASEYSIVENIDTIKIVKQIFGSSSFINSDEYPMYISSYKYLCGDWTYFMSYSVGVYEILKLKDTVTNSIYIAVLHKNPYTEDTIKLRGWHLSIFNKNVELISTFDLEKKKLFDFVSDGDMIYTDLRIIKGNLIAVITYTVTGSGGFPEKGQLFEFSIIDNNFMLVKSRPIRDGSKNSWLK